MIYNMKELLAVADENHFAIPAFNVSNYATIYSKQHGKTCLAKLE